MIKRTGECNHCGDCCKGNVYPLLNEEEKKEYEASRFNFGYCFQYDREKQRCKIYEHRPWYCYLYPDNPEQLARYKNCSYEFEEV